jgi:hypothetical protein
MESVRSSNTIIISQVHMSLAQNVSLRIGTAQARTKVCVMEVETKDIMVSSPDSN